MMVNYEIAQGEWPDEVQDWVSQAFKIVFNHFGINTDIFEISVLFTDDAKIKLLNQEFREKNNATDVLSWPTQVYEKDSTGYPNLPKIQFEGITDSLGDIAFAYETCKNDSKSKPFENHIKHLAIHSLLHLLGFNHIEDNEAEIMESVEVELLNKMNISNPYKINEI